MIRQWLEGRLCKTCAQCAHWSPMKLQENYSWRDVEGWGECQAITKSMVTSVIAVINSNDDASLYTEEKFSCSEFIRSIQKRQSPHKGGSEGLDDAMKQGEN